MSDDRMEHRRAKKIQKALSIKYTQALRIYRTSTAAHELDWDKVTPETLVVLFGDIPTK